MLPKEYKTIVGGSATVVLVTAVLNLLLKLSTALSLFVGVISGVIIGLLINNSRGK